MQASLHGLLTRRRCCCRRKRRLFAQQDLSGLIEHESVVAGIAPAEGGAAVPPSQFPLDVFDNTDYESRLPAEWVPKTPGVPPTPAKMAVYAADGSCAWEQCIVTDFDAAKNRYAVVRGSAAAVWVPRVHLYFSAEDPFVFAKRFADASAGRARAESLLRYSLFIDSMPIEDLPPISSEQANRMLSLALNSKKLKDRWVGYEGGRGNTECWDGRMGGKRIHPSLG